MKARVIQRRKRRVTSQRNHLKMLAVSRDTLSLAVAASVSPAPRSPTVPPSSSPAPSSSASIFTTPLPSSSSASDILIPRPSASKRKLGFFSSSSQIVNGDYKSSTVIVDLSAISSLLDGICCRDCGTASLSIRNGPQSMAFVGSLELWCSHCNAIINKADSSHRLPDSKSFEMSRRIVASALSIGVGHASLQKFSEGMGMTGITLNAFNSHVSSIYDKATEYSPSVLRLSREKVSEYFKTHHPDAFSQEGILDVAVSYDGTWAKRGHTSKLGCAAIIEVMTGLVIDFHVMSLHCKFCSLHAQDTKAIEDHRISGTCTINYEGSSGGMEVEGALVMWRRSQDHHMRYTRFVGDGDSKTFCALTKECPYGPDNPVEKEECVNHVAKRLNSALRNVITKCKGLSVPVTLGGRVKGSLTQTKIGLLQRYYTRAVRGHNGSVKEMSDAIWASYYHSISTPDSPQHHLCADTWCSYRKAISAGDKPPTTSDQSTYLNETVAKHVKSTYERLTDPSLLGRCLLGSTQNANESLHAVIWAKCPNHLFCGFKRVFISCMLAVGEFNMGSSATHSFFSVLDILPSSDRVCLGLKRDARRISGAESAVTAVAKRRREVRRVAQQKEQDRLEAIEGGPSYVPGGF